MDFIRLYGFGRSILIFVKYALVQAQQKKVQCKDNSAHALWIFSKQSMQITDILFYIHSKNFAKLIYYYSSAFLILSSDSGLAKSSLTFYIEKHL